MIFLLLFLVLRPFNVFGWHAYDPNKPIDSSEKCKAYSDQSSKSNLTELVTRYRLWPNLFLSGDTHQQPQLLYGMEKAMDVIHQNQNPPDCKNAKYMISNNWNGGFGSEIHVNGALLAMAITLGRGNVHTYTPTSVKYKQP